MNVARRCVPASAPARPQGSADAFRADATALPSGAGALPKLQVFSADGRQITCPLGTPAGVFAPAGGDARGRPWIAGLVNNEVCSLSYPLTVTSKLQFLSASDSLGMRVYRNSLAFLLAKTVAELFPKARFSIEHSLSSGYYCSFEMNGTRAISQSLLSRIERRMRGHIAANIPIERRKLSFADAVALFEAAGETDRLNLLRFRNPPKIVVYWCGGYFDFAHSPLAPAVGMLDVFSLIRYPPGFVLQFPDPDNPGRVARFRDQAKLSRVFQEHKQWGRTVGVETVGRLNEIIANRTIDEFIRIEEAFHEKKISRIADHIARRRNRVRVILVSGPSSSGKTTFARRLAVLLQVNGIRPVVISVDNYYVDDSQTPLDEEGRKDFEHIEALDLKLFNRDMLRLIRGREIEMPYFNFQTKRREFRGEKFALEPDQMLLIEGIHGLNPRLTHSLPNERKTTIYISALTQLNIDAHNRVSTTDNRLMRRLVRDYARRGNNAAATLRMWPVVRRGERRWVFPFQDRADAVFNSALNYELAVLKTYAEPLLMEVKPDAREYAEARRLMQFFENFLEASSIHVPPTSLLREFIGGGSFEN